MHFQYQSRLCFLPEELIIHILGLVEPSDLVTCRAVCKLLLKIIQDTLRLQYRIELYSYGMVDAESCPLAVSERLSLLRNRRQAWKDLKWRRLITPLLPGPWNAYELVDGIFSKTLNSATGILFAHLPSEDAPGSLLALQNVGMPFRDFAMDPTQDLVIYMQCNVVPTASSVRTQVALIFRTMSDNKIHPLAVRPSLDIVIPSQVEGAVIQTVNEVVGFMSWDNVHSRLFIYDWKRCALLAVEYCLAPLDDFAFLSDRAYVLTSPQPDPCFRVYTFDNNTGVHPSAAQPIPPKLRATLRLPPMHEGTRIGILGIHTGPFTTTAQQPRGHAKPFIKDPRCRTYVVNVEFLDSGQHPGGSCLVVIHSRTFFSFLSRNQAADLPWEDWGTDNTRWLAGGTGSAWLRYVHGERLVRLHAGVDNGPANLEIYDFGAPRAPPSCLNPEETTAMRKPSMLEFEKIFTAPIVSRLPCRLVVKEGSFPYSGFMIDEERLIGLKHQWADDDSVDVFTF